MPLRKEIVCQYGVDEHCLYDAVVMSPMIRQFVAWFNV